MKAPKGHFEIIWPLVEYAVPFLKTSLAQRLPNEVSSKLDNLSFRLMTRKVAWFLVSKFRSKIRMARYGFYCVLAWVWKFYVNKPEKLREWISKFFEKICVFTKNRIKVIYYLVLERRDKSLPSKKFLKRDRKYLLRFDYLLVFQLKFFRFDSRHPDNWYLLLNYVSRAYLGFWYCRCWVLIESFLCGCWHPPDINKMSKNCGC